MTRKPYDSAGTVEIIVENNLCTQCGFCEPVCPTQAITMEPNSKTGEILPRVHRDQCVMCPLCLKVCPGEEVDFDRYFRSYLGIDDYKKYSGYISKAYLAHSSDKQRRFRASSGGVTTALASYALERRFIDYLVFARARCDDPFRTETLITSDASVLSGAEGSLYYPVPLGEGLAGLLDGCVPGDARLGLIGLPCHIHGALKLADTGRFRRIRWHMIFGLFCGGTWTYRATEEFLGDHGLNRSDIRQFSYRGEGWPGIIHYTTKDGKVVKHVRHKKGLFARIYHAGFFSAYSFHTPHRCFTCSDGLADLADISFGDPWIKSEAGDRIGKTVVVTRSPKGDQLVKAAAADGRLATTGIDPDLVVASQKGMLTFKQNYRAFNRVIRFFRRYRTPRYSYNWEDHDQVPTLVYPYAFFSYLNFLLARRFRSRYMRIALTIIQGITARVAKRYTVLSARDSDNWFS